MALKFFIVPLQDVERAEADVNAFLAGHRILTVDRRWVDAGVNSYWALCIDYLVGNTTANGQNRSASNRSRVDYKELLSSDEFQLFAKLRDLRKDIAQTEAVPVYTVFTNEQLAQVVQKRVRTIEALSRIEGIGEAHVGKYGDRLLALLASIPERTDETSGAALRADP